MFTTALSLLVAALVVVVPLVSCANATRPQPAAGFPGKQERAAVEPSDSGPPPVQAQARTSEVVAGGAVEVTFTSKLYEIFGCELELGKASALCTKTNEGWSASVTVPADMPAGEVRLRWEATYGDPVEFDRAHTGGWLTITVLASQPRFAVVASPSKGPPGALVTVSFTALDKPTIISACSAYFAGGQRAACAAPTGGAGGWSAVVTVPQQGPGDTNVHWTLSYSTFPNGAVGAARGRVVFQVLRSPPPARQPEFSVVANPTSGAPGSRLQVRYSSLDPSVSITACSARFDAHEPVPCTGPAGGWVVNLRVPTDVDTGPSRILWTLSYRLRSGATGKESGASRFTVLPPAAPSPTPSQPAVATGLTGPLPWSLLVLLLAGGVFFLVGTWRRPRVNAGRRAVLPADDKNRPRSDPAVQVRPKDGACLVSVRSIGTDATRAVRLAVRVPAIAPTIIDRLGPREEPR